MDWLNTKIKEAYTAADKQLGGILPGGGVAGQFTEPARQVTRFAGELLSGEGREYEHKNEYAAGDSLAPGFAKSQFPNNIAARPSIAWSQNSQPWKIDQGARLTPEGRRLLEVYKRQPNALQEIAFAPMPDSRSGGMVQIYGPQGVGSDNPAVYLGRGDVGSHLGTMAHELGHTLDPVVREEAQTGGLFSAWKGVGGLNQAVIREPLPRLIRAATRPSKASLVEEYGKRAWPMFLAETEAQRRGAQLLQGVDPTYDPNARKSLEGEGYLRSGDEGSVLVDGWFHGGYPQSFIEDAISAARDHGYGDEDMSFHRAVSRLRGRSNDHLYEKLDTPASLIRIDKY